MIIGKLNRLITIQRRDTTVNATGNEETTYTDLFQAWASMQPFRGKEITEGQEIVASNFFVFKIRYDSRVKPKDRISYDGDLFDIKSVGQLGYREANELLAEYKDNK